MEAHLTEAAEPRSVLRAARDSLPVVAALAAAGVLAFLSGGYILGRSTAVVVAFLIAAVACVWLVRSWRPASRLFLAALACFAGLAAWTGLSVLWSFGPDLTWVAFNLTALYLVVLALVGLSPVRAVQLRVAGVGLVVICVPVAVYAYLGKVMPELVTHARTAARLSSPLGYWNALAVFVTMGLIVAVSLAGDPRLRSPWRILVAVAAAPLAFTFFFTFSRGGWLVLALAFGAYFLLTTTRLSSLWSLVSVAAPAAFALWQTRGLSTVFTETTNDALRASQGAVLLRWSLAAIVVTAVLQALGGFVQLRVRWPRWSKVAAGIVVVAVVFGGGGAASAKYMADHGGVSWAKDRGRAFLEDRGATAASSSGVGRLGSVATMRPRMWREALDQSAYFRLTGTGAGTFPFTHYRFRSSAFVVKHAHSQWLNALSELGVVGLALLAGSVLLALATALGNPFAHRRDPMQPLLTAMFAAALAFVVHISWDWEWDMAAVGVAVFALLGVAIAYRSGRARGESTAEPTSSDGAAEPAAPPDEESAVAAPEPQRRWSAGWAPRIIATLALLLLAASWLPPYLADRAETDALYAVGDGKAELALSKARRAASLDPLSVEPLLIGAKALQQAGRSGAALIALREATRLQPDNYEVWHDLGVFQGSVLGRRAAARASFTRALGLNPFDAASLYELKLVAGD